MTDLITFLDNNITYAFYTGGYLWTLSLSSNIGAPKTFKHSGHFPHHFGSSSSINNYKTTIQTVIEALCMR